MTEQFDKKKAWADDQMSRLDMPASMRNLANKLLDVYWGHTELEKLSPNEAQKLLGTFATLAQEKIIVEDEPEAVWVDAKPGELVIRDRIRVKRGAYDGPTGEYHNGRYGVITAIRMGKVYVRYTDGGPNTDLQGHNPSELEKRIR